VISVLIPSRGHPGLLRRSITSLLDHASALEVVEILVAADDDDPKTATEVMEVMMNFAGIVRVFTRKPVGYGCLHEYYQFLADRSRGEWLLVWNDDAQVLTYNWDAIITGQPEGVLVADVQSPYSPLCVFPAVRRTAVEALGRFSTANPHVDTFWQDIGRMTGTIASVPVHASLESPVKPGQTHGYYEPAHQAELKACADLLRKKLL